MLALVLTEYWKQLEKYFVFWQTWVMKMNYCLPLCFDWILTLSRYDSISAENDTSLDDSNIMLGFCNTLKKCYKFT